ncbi:MAG TPA: hypothetical protein PK695_04035 [Chitinophagaceae bacterium]|jgi:hypothetical protein|nr:hypothetical protein [Chitinophagaceae bacterium]HNJ25208.1 hypothetical protein [Chitinophagaceae bacterium]HNL58830.1 hypothetical protein [Chitinophagaceae bacterium]
MKKIILLLLLILPAYLFAQDLIGKTRNEVNVYIKKSIIDTDSNSWKLTETDSTIVCKLEKAENKDVWIFEFDKKGNCKIETYHTSSEKKYLKIRDEALKKKSYGWLDLNLNQYISKFEKNILMEMQVIDQLYSLSFIKTSLDKKLYEILVGKN